ncbi:MAG: prephenate dehydratase [Acidobacteria bacterium]|nr:prephenate dehydratase [Acidobacteriota bacterium]
MRAAFQGERGAFSEAAARKLLGPDVQVVPCNRFEDIFAALRDKRVDAAVVPIENTLHGSVHENYDHLLRFKHPIVAETSLRIVHNLIAPPGRKLKDITRVFSHPVALNQCLGFFAANPHIERVTFFDTAGSVKHLMEHDEPGAAAIASSIAADFYGARILKKSIEDDRENHTRFFLLKRNAPKSAPGDTKEWKTSIVFALRNIPGALFRAMSVFALRDINLTKIESRPIRGRPWEYHFYVDLLAHADSPNARKALGHLAEFAQDLHVLGSYPRG